MLAGEILLLTVFVRWFFACLLACAVHVPLCAQPAAKPAFKYAEAKHGPAELKYYGKIPVLAVSGTPEEIAWKPS